MKYFKLLLIVFLSIAVFGCFNKATNNSVQPEQSHPMQLLKLPENSNITLRKDKSSSKIIGVDKGGKIELSDSYTSIDGNLVTINAELKVPKGAFDDPLVNITMTSDPGYATFTFSPSMVFKKELRLNVAFTGLSSTELEQYAKREIKFVYIDDSGTIVPIKNNGVKVDQKKGILSVSGVNIYHFSRYGFAK